MSGADKLYYRSQGPGWELFMDKRHELYAGSQNPGQDQDTELVHKSWNLSMRLEL